MIFTQTQGRHSGLEKPFQAIISIAKRPDSSINILVAEDNRHQLLKFTEFAHKKKIEHLVQKNH